jgi:hypothetical protein
LVTHCRFPFVNNKNNEGKQRKKHKRKHEKCDYVRERAEKSRILQAYDNKISYTFEDGHVGRNM